MNPKNKSFTPGYVYLKDDERDYKFGVTNNPNVRLNKYKTENPRIKVLECFQTETYQEAEKIEQELMNLTQEFRIHENSREWVRRTPEVLRIFATVVENYAKKTHKEWMDEYGNELLEKNKSLKRKIRSLESVVSKQYNMKTHAEWNGSLFPAGQQPTQEARKIVKMFKDRFISALPKDAKKNWKDWCFGDMCITKPVGVNDKEIVRLQKENDKLVEKNRKQAALLYLCQRSEEAKQGELDSLGEKLAELRKQNEKLSEAERAWRKKATDLKDIKTDLQSRYNELSHSSNLTSKLSHT